MMATEGERIVALETLVDVIEEDIREIKDEVKHIHSRVNRLLYMGLAGFGGLITAVVAHLLYVGAT